MKRQLFRILIFSGVTLLALNVWFYFQLPSMMFFPDRNLVATPKSWGLEYEEVELLTSDQVRIHGWYVPANNSKQVLLFFHGNAGNISHRGDSIEIFHRLGLNILSIDYRGYGKSDGVMSEQGAYRDAMAAWRYLIDTKHFPPENIILFGRSLGGAVATHLASQVNEKALIVESTFTSIRDLARRTMPVVNEIVWLRYDFATEDKIGQVGSPILLMHSQQDEIIPYEMAERNFAAAKSPRYFHELKGDHNSGFLNDVAGYVQALQWFLDEV